MLSSCATSSAPVQTKKRPLVAGPLQEMVGPFYGRLGACDGGGVKPSIVGGAAGALVCGGGRYSMRHGLAYVPRR